MLVSGWQLTGIVSVQSGQPFTVTAGTPAPLTALTVGTRSPNAVAGSHAGDIILGGTDQYFDSLAFTSPGPRELGNLGRNSLNGPRLAR